MKATSSDEYTPTTEQVREAASPNGGIAVEPEAFNRWLAEVEAKAWDEGFAAGVNTDMGDYEHPPEIVANPYREENTDD